LTTKRKMNHSNKRRPFSRRTMTAASAAVLGVSAAASSALVSADGRYVTGDFHNHTTCSDGTLSVQKLVDKSINAFDLDWFVQAGHGGFSARNCTLAEDPFEPTKPALNLTVPPAIPSGGQPASDGKGPNQTWVATLPNGAAGIKGDVVLQSGVRAMWKWQEIQEFIYPVLDKASLASGKPVFTGLEQVVPGHEHASTGITDGQLKKNGKGDATLISQYEYCFDRADTDRSRGADNKWDCKVPGSPNSGASNPLFDATARKIIVPAPASPPVVGSGLGTAGHAKTLEGVKFMAEYAPDTSYFVPAHLERAGAFNPDNNAGYNIEHLRDFNNVSPDIAFGFESMPGHQAEANRGSYSPSAVGGGTYGGTGVYAAAVGGVWDALLGEGRKWWFFASSDFHNRGSFGPDQRESSADFFPGEYTKDHVAVKGAPKRSDVKPGKRPTYEPYDIVEGLRRGDSFVTNGDLIDRLGFLACAVPRNGKSSHGEELATAARNGESIARSDCAGMGETLTVRRGDDVIVQIVVRDPSGTNNSPYSFNNPSLLQLGINQPLNSPVLDHFDLIAGNVTGKISPSDTARYAGLLGSPAATNPSAKQIATYNKSTWQSSGDERGGTYRIADVTADQYVRVRGTNLPPATPFETDSQGNPLLDFGSSKKIPCTDAACPAHLVKDAAGAKTSSLDVAAWSDLWFYGNPIFIKVQK
jgi:hypothetical protein